MGFWSAIGTAIVSFFSGVGQVLKAIGHGIAAAVSGFAVGLEALCPTLGIVGAIVNLIAEVAQILIGKPEDEMPEDMALRAEQAEMDVDDFESFDAYMHYLRTEIASDKKRLAAMSDVERDQYALVGSGMYAKQMGEKFGITLSPGFWFAANRAHLSAQDTSKLAVSLQKNGIEDAGVVHDYLQRGAMPMLESEKVYDALDQMFAEHDPESTEVSRSDAIYALRETYGTTGV